MPTTSNVVAPKEKKWGFPLMNLIAKPLGAVIMLPVKVVGTVAFGVHHGIQHVAHMVSGTEADQLKQV